METKKEIYIISSFFALLALALVLFFIYPIFKEISSNSKDFISKRNDRISLENQFSEAEKFKQRYEFYKLNLEKINSLLIDSENPVDFIKYLEQKASELKVNLQVSSPTVLKEGSFNVTSFQLKASGTFSAILKFMHELEMGPYLITLKSVDMNNLGSVILINVLSK